MEEMVRGRVRGFLLIAAISAALFIFNYELLVTRTLMASHDTLRTFVTYAYFAENLLNGSLPLWDPYTNSGSVFFPNNDILQWWEPANLFILPFIKIFKIDLLTAFHYVHFLMLLIFVCGSYFFMRRITRHWTSAVIGLLSISFSVLAVGHWRQAGFLGFIYLTPWLLFFIFKLFDDKRPYALVPIAFIMGTHACNPYAFINLLFVTMLVITFFFFKRLPLSGFKGTLLNYRYLVPSILIFALMALRAVALFDIYSDGLVPAVKEQVVGGAASQVNDFFLLLNPYLFSFVNGRLEFFSEAPLYIGLLPLSLAVVALIYSKQRSIKWPLFITALVTSFIMLGDDFLVFPFLRAVIPILETIRSTHLFAPFLLFALASLAALGADTFLDGLDKKSEAGGARLSLIPVLTGCVSFLTLAVFIYFRSGGLAVPYAGSLANTFFFIVAVVVIFVLLPRFRLSDNFTRSAIVALVFVDLIVFGAHYIKMVTLDRDGLQIERELYIKGFPYNETSHKMLLPPKEFSFYWPLMRKEFVGRSPNIYYGSHFFETSEYYDIVRSSVIPGEVKTMWTGVSKPRARLVGTAIKEDKDEPLDIAALYSAGRLDDAVILADDLPENYAHLSKAGRSVEGSVTNISFAPNKAAFKVVASADAFLYYGDGYDKRWQVHIDGKRGRLFRANRAFKAVIVPKGTHTVTFSYRPGFYIFSLYIYFFLLAVIIFWGVFYCLRAKPFCGDEATCNNEGME